MYKVMIVDDEKSIRNLLKNIINKGNLDLDIVGEANSGIEAINIIDRILPDIIFVDIKMPFMDGVEFSKIVIDRYPNLKIIILTAYSDFNYARDCIGIGVCEYLLKPIVKEDILKTLSKVMESLDLLKPEKEEEISHKENTISNIKQYIKDNYKKHDLNLRSIAQKFGFNTSYLSRLFKAETGVNLIDYIIEYRMNKALEYAKEGKFMYITAKLVGIPDPNYFGKCFKKYTNKKYSEYVKKYKV